ncbi:hypothetical protein M406DRAFT_290351 [Cryphonectria parasitica EP155]|uniref:C2H2-type domain-containing protein n=1 Tax=Cryphonectria parasitica (strain ATCC 38755 / EP155) TaxID=660469 RepID=A0A9P4Y4I2_CRYP1|nr:uncharacterized protein M406DRAFT_290351 [Cryphonectria parasitica EP155]KAF3766020.1 hypothetical protein M406DRAFT_290351 [Cryphonectria parasitica EP155]
MWLTPTTTTSTHRTSTLHGNNTYYDEDNSISHSNRSSFSYIPTSLDIDSEIRSQASTESSPPSNLGFSPLSTFDSLPVPRAATTAQGVLFQLSTPAFPSQHLFPPSTMMFTDTWPADAAQFALKANNGRNLHHRDSSLSSLGSMGPASPFSFSSSNPQIAVNDTSDTFTGLPMQDDQSYQLAAKAPNSVSHDTFYANYPFGDASVQSYANILAPQRHRGDRSGLLPPPDFPSGGSTNSRPGSVASSVASDSPATPAAPEPEEERRRKNGISAVPKLDRTMTDIFSDELYNPNFTITSAPPSQPSQTAMSPTHDLFVQRVQAANNQHLSATQSPNSSGSRGRSPFRQGSPLAPTPSHNFPQASANMRFNTAQQMREKVKAEHDSAQALRQTMAHSASTGTPQTISPKDAVLEFNDADNANNFPLFPQQQQHQQQQPQQQHQTSGFNANQMAKATSQANNFNNSLSLDTTFDNYLTSQLSSGLQMPAQYPFISKPRQELPSGASPSFSMTSHAGSSPSVTPESAASASPKRPNNVAAEGGTYTCTYHGCTQRFETPALLQKHKREGHRQSHGLSSLRRPEGPSGSYFNTQAGPHKCERINPSTGKPCNTIFSRPYDLTRHEDTIHNGRKQKVRCDVCTEEKTFSRADALTRHYRVCHPDLEFPGKHRKRVSNN